jgi:hypothetical protein
MIQPDELAILWFENMSGLRINFHKSEVMVLGTTDKEKQSTAKY